MESTQTESTQTESKQSESKQSESKQSEQPEQMFESKQSKQREQMFEFIRSFFNTELYQWMKEFYSIYSIDNIQINILLDQLNHIYNAESYFKSIKSIKSSNSIRDENFSNRQDKLDELYSLIDVPYDLLNFIEPIYNAYIYRYLSKEEIYSRLKVVFNSDIYDWMKIQYCDVCSNGDVAINFILEQMNSQIDISVKDENLTYITHIYDTYLMEYLLNYKPNPFWAS